MNFRNKNIDTALHASTKNDTMIKPQETCEDMQV